MTAEQYRASLRQGAPAHGYSLDKGADVTDLFALTGISSSEPHPDFAARAAIWKDQRAGLLSLAEAQRRSAAVGVSNFGLTPSRTPARACARPRHQRPAPNESRQYAQPMATTAARDDRLTPNAKAFLQVLTARCGKGRETIITKGTAGNIMARSARTIRRYLVDLVRFGYVEVQTRANARGLHLGLTVRITDLVRPFFEEARGLARWLAETPAAAFRPFESVLLSGDPRVTKMHPKNQTQIILSSSGEETSRRATRRTALRLHGGKVAPSS